MWTSITHISTDIILSYSKVKLCVTLQEKKKNTLNMSIKYVYSDFTMQPELESGKAR